MKNFCFANDGYGNSYHLMAEDPQVALDALKTYFKKKAEEEIARYPDAEQLRCNECYNYAYREKWSRATLERLPKGFSLVAYAESEVYETEHS